VDEVIVKYKGRVIFGLYIPKEYLRFEIKLYKICDAAGCAYTNVYFGKDKKPADRIFTVSHATVKDLCKRSGSTIPRREPIRRSKGEEYTYINR
jgi:hypothetical protein